jgi:hypothetical protein
MQREEGEIPTETQDEEEEEELDFDDDDMDDVLGGTEELLSALLATPEGDTVCTALVHIGTQLEMQNKILIKILSKLA